jgi:type VI secretion system protein VasJ
MNRQTVQIDPEWLTGIGAPLPETPCGEDPRYQDKFQQIKEEIDKLREVDYSMIMASCRDLLTGVAKDLRIGGYLLVAGTYVDGLPGLLDGLRAYRALLDNFWEHCHPRNETGRLAALNLLGNPRIVAFAEQKEEGVSRKTFVALQQEVDRINSFLVEKLGEEAPRLSGLAHWLEERLRRLEPAAPATEGLPKAEPGPPPTGAKAAATAEATSEQGIETLTRQIHRHSLNSGELLRAMAYSRAFRWGKLPLPPNEGGRTRIPAPRPGGLVEFEKALSGDPLENVLICCENLFFEPGFQLLFDLQFQAFRYFGDNQRPDLAGFIRNALLDLLERHPQLLELQFDDGTPFAGPECRQWIRECRVAGLSGSGPTSRKGETSEESTAAVIDQAMQLAKRKKLPEALQSLHSLPFKTEKQRIRKRLTEARLCLAAGKAHMAEAVLEEVQNHILAHHLATWDPGLAIEVLQQRLAVLQSLEKGCSGEGKLHIAKQMQEVRRLICKTDVIAAATLV